MSQIEMVSDCVNRYSSVDKSKNSELDNDDGDRSIDGFGSEGDDEFDSNDNSDGSGETIIDQDSGNGGTDGSGSDKDSSDGSGSGNDGSITCAAAVIASTNVAMGLGKNVNLIHAAAICAIGGMSEVEADAVIREMYQVALERDPNMLTEFFVWYPKLLSGEVPCSEFAYTMWITSEPF